MLAEMTWVLDLDIKAFFDNLDPKSTPAGSGEETRIAAVDGSLYRTLAESASGTRER